MFSLKHNSLSGRKKADESIKKDCIEGNCTPQRKKQKNFTFEDVEEATTNWFNETFVKKLCVQNFAATSGPQEIGMTGNDMVVAMLKFVMNPKLQESPPSIPLRILEEKFRSTFDKHSSIKAFKDIAGMPFRRFLENNKDHFNVLRREKKGIVKEIVNIVIKKNEQQSFAASVPSLQFDKHEKPESMMETKRLLPNIKVECMLLDTKVPSVQAEEAMSLQSDEEGHQFPPDLNESQSDPVIDQNYDESEEWQTVPKYKSEKNVQISKKHRSAPNYESIKGLSKIELNEKSEEVCLLEKLLHQIPGRDLIIYPDDIYQSDPCKLMLDIISMWNTPQRFRSHIVLGMKTSPVPPHSLNGLKLSCKDKDYQQLFQGNYFTVKPMFHCISLSYHGKLCIIIEVQSSYGFGQPSIVKSDREEGEMILHVGQLWYRPYNENKVCSPLEPDMMSIYQWFSEQDGKGMGSPGNTHVPYAGNSNSKKYIEESIPIKREGTTVRYFMDCVRQFNNGHYILISADVKGTTENLQAFSCVPWIAVYDFDINSRDNGFFSVNQDLIEKKRLLSIATWKKTNIMISGSATLWCFMRGARDMSGTRTDDPKEEKIEDVRDWFSKVSLGLEWHCQQLAKFVEDCTVLTAVILWPQEEALVPIMHKFIDQLDDKMGLSLNLVICLSQHPKTKAADSILEYMKTKHRSRLFICKVNLETFFLAIINQRSSQEEERMNYQLPVEGNQNIDIKEKDAVWLREDMHVLYYKSEFAKTKCDVDVLDKEAEQFYRGGTLQWFAWYNCGMSHYDIERDLMKEVTKHINYLITESCRAAVIRIFHAPGSGGTTLGQRILWTFHERTPCIQLKLHTASSIQDVTSKIEFIHKKSHLPVIVLIDGEDETNVKHIAKQCMAFGTIIISMKRYLYPITCSQKNKAFFLKGTVSSEEATRLALKFGDRCKGNYDKRHALEKLSKEVMKGVVHYLYEFGMTTYLHEYKGIQSYVKGYLQLEDNPTKELLPWQKILGFLSLAYYYGQASLPCQIFAALLNQPSNYYVSLDDFQYPFQEFVVLDTNEGRTNFMRICSYYIAKEILEQLLNRQPNSETDVTNCSELSIIARQNLEKFCLDFIDVVSGKKARSNVQSSTVSHILARIFIFRDNKDMGETEEQHKKRLMLSRVMMDIASKPPLFTERLHILEKLTISFPENPNFHAHLGRFYSNCRPDGEAEAEKHFKKALSLCEAEIIKQDGECNEITSQTLMHIYHMYGMIFLKKIAKFTGRNRMDKPEIQTEESRFQQQLQELVLLAESACSHFYLSRKHTPSGHETSLAYTGELQVRLQICDFVHRFCKNKEPENHVPNLIEIVEDVSTKDFISSSISKIDSLILECFASVEPGEIDHSLQQIVTWYFHLFKPMAEVLEMMPCQENIYSRRLKIAAKKLKYSTKNENLALVERITNSKEVREIVNLYEENFKEVAMFGLQAYGRKSLEQDYREWLLAIRHEYFDKDYNIEEVLLHVQQWNDYVSSPLSKFYLFVLNSLLGFGSCISHGSTENLVDAQNLKDEMMKLSYLIIKPRYPREWLGKDENDNGKSIKQLIPGNRLRVGWTEDREVKVLKKVCKGTICSPNKKTLAGSIDLDLGDNTIPVKVFFIPSVAQLEGSRFAGCRVEFQLGFSIEKGYEAFEVKQLNKYGCSKCTARFEISSGEDIVICSTCRIPVHKTELNSACD